MACLISRTKPYRLGNSVEGYRLEEGSFLGAFLGMQIHD